MIEPLIQAVRNRQAILFVGAGVSRQLGLPSWNELISEMAKQLDYDPAVFQSHGGYLELAEFYKIKKTSMGSLRSWMDRTWHTDEARVDNCQTHRSIVALKCPLIYTTNYDRWLEIAFARYQNDFVKIANVGDFTKIRDGVTQIVKLHGDLDDDTSLVLTESSYFDRLAFESPLDIKLRSDSLGKSILFVGYSLTDVNIPLSPIQTPSTLVGVRFSLGPTEVLHFLDKTESDTEGLILGERGITSIVSEVDDEGTSLTAFLERLVRDAFGTS